MKSLLIVAFVALTSSLYSQGHGGENFVPGQLLVLLEQQTEIDDVCDDLSSKLGLEVEPSRQLLNSFPLWLIQFDGGVLETEEALEFAWALRGITIAQFNHNNIVHRAEPDDPEFDEQWNFYNDGTNGGSGTADVDAKSAWDITTGGVTANGDTIVVAVIDGGFNVEHEDLEQNIFRNNQEIPGNGVDDDNNGYIDDVHGWNVYSTSGSHFFDNHGNHVAGTIGARGNNGIGVTGVNWEVKILPISGSSTIESTVLESYGYVLDMRRLYNSTNGEKGAYVISTNSSFGVDEGDPLDYPLWCAMYDSMGIAGVVSAGATANANWNIDEIGDVPTACGSNFLISVTNTTSEDVKNGGAAYGLTTIDIGAPGTSIYSTRTSGYGNSTGTSMATPHVAGAIALMLSALCEDVLDSYSGNPGGLALYLKQKLLDEGVDELSSLDGLVSSGGRLNLFKAVSAVSDSCLTVIANTTSSSCGDCNGIIDIQVLGGNPPFNYSWNTGATTAQITDLCAGTYSVTISDASGDSTTQLIALSDSLSPVVGWTASDPTCFGFTDGSIDVDTGYTYAWGNGSVLNQRTGLGSGIYQVSITSDSSSCTAVELIELVDPDPITISSSTIIPIPYAGSNGEIIISITGGTPPYSVEWEGGASGMTITDLSVGSYGVTITDANGCVGVDTVLLGYPAGLESRQESSLTIFPNPVSSQLSIVNNKLIDEVTIHDLQGRVVMSMKVFTSNTDVDVSMLRSGIYVVSVSSDQQLIRQKIQVIE